ncbi:MAG: zinc ribbon domain-containing protein [Candidatus Omnitrophota bacterium]
MPTYDYQCESCAHEFELFQKMTDNPIRKCPECGRLKAKRRIGSGMGIIFKGSGFYETDYKRKEPPTKETAPKTEDSQVKKAGDNQGKTKSENYPEKKPGNSEKARKTEKKN